MEFVIKTNFNTYKIPYEYLKYCNALNKYYHLSNKLEIIITENYFTDEAVKIIIEYLKDKMTDNKIQFEEENKIMDINLIFNLIASADLLDINDLYQIQRKLLITNIKECKNANEFRKEYNIDNDLDERENFEIEQENVWCDKNGYLNLSNLQFSTMIETKDKKNFDKILNTPPNDVTRFVKKRKLIIPIKDESVEKCYNCEIIFSTFNRKHHCRSCGRIFCNICSGRTINLPEEDKSLLPDDIVQYNILNILSFSKEVRVCDKCYNNIIDQKSYSEIIIIFKIISFQIDHLKKLATICHKWRKAAIWCLSSIRELQYRLPTREFDKYETRALWNNRNYWIGHSQWIFQLFRIVNNDSEIMINIIFELIKIDKKIDCYKTMCSRLCYQTLKPQNFLYLLGKNYKNKSIRDFAIDIIDKANIEEKNNYIIILINNLKYEQNLNNSNLVELIIKIALTNNNSFTKIYWLINSFSEGKYKYIYSYVLQNLLIKYVSNNSQGLDYIKKILNTYYFFHEMYKFKDKLIEKNSEIFENNFIYPFNPNNFISKILYNEIIIKESATIPMVIPIIDSNNKKKCILFKNDDIRSDMLILNIIKIMKSILETDELTKNINIPIIIYETLPINSTSGIIEIIQNAYTLYEIIKIGSINTYLVNNNKEKIVGDIYNNYTNSLAFWTVATHLLGVGDRHLDNIMMTYDGIIFHIDFSFILGQNPNNMVPMIRMTKELIEGLGGIEKYKEFKELCGKIFITLRRHSILFFNVLIQLHEFDPIIKNGIYTPKYLEDQLLIRFLTGQADNEAINSLTLLIDQSCDTLLGNITDYFHHCSKKSPMVKTASSVVKTFSDLFSWII
jgi:hypothetical protein